MKKLIALCCIGMMMVSIVFAQKTMKAIVYFDHDMYRVQPSSTARLDSLMRNLKNKEITAVSITGHTDSDGSNGYNDTLSQNRAKTVSDFFTSKGVDKSKIKIDFYGETKPVATNSDDAGKQKNRRVEILIQYKDVATADFFSGMQKQAQVFKVSASDVITIVGKEGTKITIPASSFVTMDGKKVSGQVSIQLKEFYKISDMIEANLVTASDSDILETSGMINIEATSGGQQLKLADGALMDIVFKNKTTNDSMALFTGQEKDKKINWVLQQNMASGQLSDTSYYSTEKLMSQGTGQDAPVNGVFNKTTVITKGKHKGMVGINGGVTKDTYDTTSMKNQTTFDALIMRSSKLGWLNCDHFMNKQNIIGLLVKIDPVLKPTLRLVFKGLNSVIDGNYSFAGVTFILTETEIIGNIFENKELL